jgi:hypothetical protein
MTSDADYQTKARKWLAEQAGGDKNATVGAMLRPTEIERWNAWKAYFQAKACKAELHGMELCERDRGHSREPGTNICWRMFPADWPHEFDPKGAADARA